MTNKKNNNNVFIHIPKCGGSSFVGLLKESSKLSFKERQIATHLIQQVGNTHINHVDFSTSERKFRAPEIFDSIRNKDLLNKTYFMLVRNPVDRLLSEYNFQYHILNGKSGNPNAAIVSKLSKMPHTFPEYSDYPETQNYQCKFLLGRKIADPNPVNEKEYQSLIKSIEHLNIHCGLTELFSSFLTLFSNETNISLKSEFIKRKETPSQLKTTIDKKVRDKINEMNSYDFALYTYIKEKVNLQPDSNSATFTAKSHNQFIP